MSPSRLPFHRSDKENQALLWMMGLSVSALAIWAVYLFRGQIASFWLELREAIFQAALNHLH